MCDSYVCVYTAICILLSMNCICLTYVICMCGRDLFDTRTGQWESAAGGGAGVGGGGGYNRMPVIDDW